MMFVLLLLSICAVSVWGSQENSTEHAPLGVFGGTTVSQQQYDNEFSFLVQPWAGQVWCTSTLIAPRWVLFAAHCINSRVCIYQNMIIMQYVTHKPCHVCFC
jgi:secreted trypsin-like serine protease